MRLTRHGVAMQIDSLEDASLTTEDLKTITADSAGWSALWPKLSLEALIERTATVMNNCSRPAPSTSDAALIDEVIPALIQRLQDYNKILALFEN